MKLLSPNFLAVVGLAAVFIFALILRLECARDELWIDEYITAWTVADSWEVAGERAKFSHQAPLYTGLIYGVTGLAGLNPAALRGPSLVCGMLLVILCAWLAWRLTKLRSAAILAAFLAAIDPDFVFYASEARPYALVQLLGAGGAICVWKWFSQATEGNGRAIASVRPLVVFTTTSIAGFYLHFTHLIAITCQLIAGWAVALRLRKGWRGWLVVTVIFGAASIPGLVALREIHAHADDWQGFSSVGGLLHELRFSGLMYLLPALTGLACAAVDPCIRQRADWRGITLISMMSLATVGGVLALTATGLAPLGHIRYAIAATGLGPAIGACYLAAFSREWMRGCTMAVLILAGWMQTSINVNPLIGSMQPPMRWERWSLVVEEINRQATENELPVVVFPNLIEDHRIADDRSEPHRSYFWAPLVVLNSIDERTPLFALPAWSDDRFGDEVLAQIRRAEGVWLVLRGGAPGTSTNRQLTSSILEELQSKLGPDGGELKTQWFGPSQSDVQLWRVTLTESP